MKYAVYAIIPLVVGLFVPVIIALVQKRNIAKERKLDNNNFSVTGVFAIVILSFIVDAIMLILIILLAVLYNIDIGITIILLMFFIMFSLITLGAAREKVVVQGDKITYTPPFKKVRNYMFEDIKFIKTFIARGARIYQVYGHNNKKLFIVSTVMVGTNLFIERINLKGIEIRQVKR